jgi:hypothetical protein
LNGLKKLPKTVAIAIGLAFCGGIGAALYGSVAGHVHRALHPPPPAVSRPPIGFVIRRDEEGFSVVSIPRQRATNLAATHNCNTLEEAARADGGADPQQTLLSVLAQGRAVDTATIVAMRAVIVSRSRPTGGAGATCAGGGAESPLRLTFNLDSRTPVALRTVGSFSAAHTAGPFFIHGRVVNLAPHEVQPLLLAANAKRYTVEWKIRVTVQLGSRTRTITVSDRGGRPFRTTPVTYSAPLYEYRVFRFPHDLVVWKSTSIWSDCAGLYAPRASEDRRIPRRCRAGLRELRQ